MSFIVIEGLDGSGKSTQIRLLKEHLKKNGKPFRYLHFPRLDEGLFGQLVARFLRGEMGEIDQVDPYLVALIFASDRKDASDQIQSWIDSGFLVILDRYVYSNIAFQCAKIGDTIKGNELRDWILHLEFEYNKIPRPDVNLFLDVPIKFIKSQLGNSREGDDRDYLRGRKDIHEDSIMFQEQVREVYLELENYVEDLEIVNCQDEAGEMLLQDLIFKKIIEKLDGKL